MVGALFNWMPPYNFLKYFLYNELLFFKFSF
jgi:hypothetical protein